MQNIDLIERAAALLNPHKTVDGRLFGDVAAVVVSCSGKVYSGVCVDTASWGLCAERSAMAAMITNGEYAIEKVVAVWKSGETGQLHVLPPCGVCREFMRQISERSLDADVVLGRDEVTALRNLLPKHEWPAPLGSPSF